MRGSLHDDGGCCNRARACRAAERRLDEAPRPSRRGRRGIPPRRSRRDQGDGARRGLARHPASLLRHLGREDGLYLVTDGITESRRADGELFGDERLHRALAEANELRDGAGDAVLVRLEAWLRPNALDDDATIVALRPSLS